MNQPTYTVERELVLEPEMHLLPADVNLMKYMGYKIDTPPDVLLLAQLEFNGTLEDNAWYITASVKGTEVGAIRCSPDTERDEVPEVIQRWLEDSAHITKMHRRRPVVYPIHEVDTVGAMTLARGDRLP